MAETYVWLDKILPDAIWGAFDLSEYYHGEQNILKPALERMGFTNVHFIMGERDSFGPLSRIVCCTDKAGNRHRFVCG